MIYVVAIIGALLLVNIYAVYKVELEVEKLKKGFVMLSKIMLRENERRLVEKLMELIEDNDDGKPTEANRGRDYPSKKASTRSNKLKN